LLFIRLQMCGSMQFDLSHRTREASRAVKKAI